MRRTVALAVVASLSLLAAACSDDADQSTDADQQAGPVEASDAIPLLRQAPGAADQAGPRKFEMEVVLSSAETGDVSMTASGAIDPGRPLMEVQVDMSSIFEAAEAQGQPVPFDDLTVETIVTPDAFYVRGAMYGDQWVTGPTETMTGGLSGNQFLSRTAGQPSAYLDFVRGADGEAEIVGEEEVRGVPTTHYSTEFTFADALEETPEDQRQRMEALVAGMPDGVLDTPTPIDIWVDRDGLPRRIELSMDALMAEAGSGDVDARVRAEWFDFGEPIAVATPAESETVPLDEFAQR